MVIPFLAAWGLYEVTLTASPVIDNRTQTADNARTPTKAADGTWELLWIDTDKTGATVAEYDANLAAKARNQRNSLMIQTDWVGLSDTTMTPAMLTYRQALHDVPAQSGFPTSVAWPTKP